MFSASSAQVSGKTYVDDVFSTYIYDGNGSAQTITNGIDLAGHGGMVWTKGRSTTTNHGIHDTSRPGASGDGNVLVTNTTAAETTVTSGGGGHDYISSYLSNGFTVVEGSGITSGGVANDSGTIYTSWTFRNAPKFFTHTTISHTNGTATNVDLSTLGTVGMVVAKITTTTGDWITWHRSLTAGNNLFLNSLASQSTTNAWLSVSGTTATLSSSATTGTYVIYAWAHNTDSDGMVRCGSLISGGAVNLGWEPQFILTKRAWDTGTGDWPLHDSLRGLGVDILAKSLFPNNTNAEGAGGAIDVTSTGFINNNASNIIYLAIRIPNKPPTTGTEVFQPTVYTGTNVDNRLVTTGIKTDMAWFRMRSGSGAGYEGFVVGDRLRGQPWLKTGSTQAETTTADGLDQQIVTTTEYGTAFSSMTGVWVGNNTGASTTNTNINANTTANNHIVEAFKRAPGFFDVVCYTGNATAGRTVPHQLGAVPELMIAKSRATVGGGATEWFVYAAPLGATLDLKLSTTSASASSVAWNSTPPTSSAFTVGGGTNSPNASGIGYVAYLFATLPGISKVGSYTGTGSTQTINCGFTTGARFVMIKNTTTAADWVVFDTARGIVGGGAADPSLRPSSTTAENSSNQLGPDNSGFILESTGTNTNSVGDTFIYLAIA